MSSRSMERTGVPLKPFRTPLRAMLTRPVYQMARRLLYTHDVIGRRLSLQLALVMLLVALVPLAGAGFLILGLLGRSLSDQVRAHHDQLARTSGAMVRNYIDGSLAKLRNIGAMIKAQEEP